MKYLIELAPLISLDSETQFQVLAIRNEPKIREVMFTDHVISATEHLEWLNGMKQDRSRLVFVILDVEDGRKPQGVVSVSGIDRIHRKADWAFYLKENHKGGLGSAIELVIIDFVFQELGLLKLNCEVLEGNDTVIKLHKKFYFEDEGLRKSNISKNGTRMDVCLLGLSKERWLSHRDSVVERYGKVFERFEIKINWKPNEKADDLTTIDRIQAARAKNNLNWMSILRIALEKAPGTSQQIVTEIRKLDGEISALTDELIKPE